MTAVAQSSTALADFEQRYSDISFATKEILALVLGFQSPGGTIQTIETHVKENESLASDLDKTSEFLSRLRDLIINLVIEVSWAQQPLVELIVTLVELGDQWTPGMLDDFGMHEGDAHGSLMCAPSPAEWYININGFEARMWERMEAHNEYYILSSPICTFARSVEKALPGDGSQTADAEIGAACMWAIHASDSIWKLCRAGKEPDQDEKTFHGDLWMGRRGYSVERWEMWLGRFDEITSGTAPGVSAETRQYAFAAKSSMVRSRSILEADEQRESEQSC